MMTTERKGEFHASGWCSVMVGRFLADYCRKIEQKQEERQILLSTSSSSMYDLLRGKTSSRPSRSLHRHAVGSSPVWAQISADHQSRLWKAQWISAPGVSQKDEVVLHFRKVIEVSKPSQHFYVDVSADNQFIFHVNQRRVGNGPSRSDLAPLEI